MQSPEDLIKREEFDKAADTIVSCYTDWVAGQDITGLDFQSAPKKWFDENLTFVLNNLIKLNSHYTKEEIQFVFRTHAAQVAALANVCRLVAETEL